MNFKVGEIADVKLLDNDGNVIMSGEMYNNSSTPREIALAKKIRELESLLKEAQHVLIVNNLDGYDVYNRIVKYLNSTK